MSDKVITHGKGPTGGVNVDRIIVFLHFFLSTRADVLRYHLPIPETRFGYAFNE